MASKCVARMPHSCGSLSALQVFEDQDTGEITGYCFSCSKFVRDPLGDKTLDDLPASSKKVKTDQEIEEEINELSTYPTIKWTERKLSKSNLEHFGITTSVSEENGTTPKAYHFPYTDGGNLVRIKTRLVEEKRMWSTSKQSAVDLFGWEQAVRTGARRLIITEGECFTPDSQVLTPEGWVSFQDYSGQQVMQVNQDGSGEFVNSLAVVDKEWEGNLVEYSSGSYYSLTTPEHNMVRLDKEGLLFKAKAEEKNKKHYNVPRTLKPSTKGMYNNLDLRLKVMVSADFSIRESGDVYGSFKKERKIQRARDLLNISGIRYSSKEEAREGCWNIYIHRGHGKDFSKDLLWEDIRKEEDCFVLLDELLNWDGNLVPNRNQIEYSTNRLHNAEVVQAAAHRCGYTSTIISRRNQYGSWFKVSILFGKQTSSTQKGYREVPYKGRVMCITVPSGMLLVRQKGSISVSGNCDAVALHAIIERYTKEQYKDFKPAVCSLPNGAASASKDLARLAQKIRRHFKEVVFCFDNDEPGDNAATECMKVFPEAKSITLPEKDANDCILKGATKAAFNAVTFKAEKRKNTRLVNGKDLHQQARQPAVWGFPWPWEHLNKATRGIRFGETIYIGSAPKMGKSEVVNALAAHFLKHDMKVLLAKPEEANNKSYKMVAGKLVGAVFHDPDVEFDNEAYDRAGEMTGDNLFMINLYQHMGWETLQSDIRDAASQGVKAVFIDPITNLTNGMNSADANTKLQTIAQELSAMALDLDIVIFIFCHLRNPDNGPDHTRGGQVLSSQFAGSRAMMRSCNLMIGLEGNRDPELTEEERNIRTLSLLEDREFGSVGKFPLYWNKHNTLFTEM